MVAMVVASLHQFQSLPPCGAFQTVGTRGESVLVRRSARHSDCNAQRPPAFASVRSDGAGAAAGRRGPVAAAFVRGRRPPPGPSSLPTAVTATSLAATGGDGDGDSDNKKKKRKTATKAKAKAKAAGTKKRSSTKKPSPTDGESGRTRSTATAKGGVDDDDDDGVPIPDPPSASLDATTVASGRDDAAEMAPPPVMEAVPIPVAQLAASQREAELEMHAARQAAIRANTSPDGTYYGPLTRTPDMLQFDVTGGRPGAIIESEDELERKRVMFEELNSGKRTYEEEWLADYGYLEEEAYAMYTTDDPDAIDATTLGQYDITDLNTKFDWEWNPETDPDPNSIPSEGRYLAETEKDEEGVEKGYDPYFGPSNPVDERTLIGTVDSYMIDEKTRDEKMLTPQFRPGDPEIAYNEEIVRYRKSMDIIESYVDRFLPGDMPVPRNVAKWYGYPEPMRYPQKNYTNNRFTKVEHLTNFDELTPFRARQKAVELARAKNAEWLPPGVSQAWHREQRRPYEEVGTLVGTLRPGKIDGEILETIQPALKVLGSCAILLSIEGEGRVFRFHYHGLMKNRAGMEAWTETLIRDCGAEVTGVVFETGFRTRDPSYDGGDPYHGWN